MKIPKKKTHQLASFYFFFMLKTHEEEPKINRTAVARYGHHIKIITKPVKRLLVATIYVVFMHSFMQMAIQIWEKKGIGKKCWTFITVVRNDLTTKAYSEELCWRCCGKRRGGWGTKVWMWKCAVPEQWLVCTATQTSFSVHIAHRMLWRCVIRV